MHDAFSAQECIAAAYMTAGHQAEVVSLSPIGTQQYDLDTLLRELQSKSHLVRMLPLPKVTRP
jgi:hypothetical protein